MNEKKPKQSSLRCTAAIDLPLQPALAAQPRFLLLISKALSIDKLLVEMIQRK